MERSEARRRDFEEHYPTRVRGSGTGFAASMGHIAGALTTFITPYLGATMGTSSMFSVFTFVYIFADLSVLALGIETKGQSLEEISR